MSTNYVQAVLDRLHASVELESDLADLYALLALTKGTTTTLQDVHDAWSLWRNTTNPGHRSLVPFNELTDEVQEMDREYMDAIHKAARSVRAQSC